MCLLNYNNCWWTKNAKATVADRNKTETQNRKQNYKIQNQKVNTKPKTETQNRKQIHKSRKQKYKMQNTITKYKTET